MIPLKDTIPSRHWPWMTVLLIGANIYIFYLQTGLTAQGYHHLVQNHGLFPLEFTRQLRENTVNMTPLFSYMFLHGGLFHLISNMWALWLFGDNVEDRMGSSRFLMFYLFCGLASALVHIYFNPLSPVPTIGASGAIAGVMGAYFFMYPSAKIVTLIPIFILPWFVEIPAMIYLAFWFFSQIYSALMSQGNEVASGVAWWAHVGGFLGGMLTYRLFAKEDRRRY